MKLLRRSNIMYSYKCEYCDGTVKERIIKKEAFKHKDGFVTLEDVPIGVCDKCGYRYYHSTVLKRFEDIASGKKKPERTEAILVAHS